MAVAARRDAPRPHHARAILLPFSGRVDCGSSSLQMMRSVSPSFSACTNSSATPPSSRAWAGPRRRSRISANSHPHPVAPLSIAVIVLDILRIPEGSQSATRRWIWNILHQNGAFRVHGVLVLVLTR